MAPDGWHPRTCLLLSDESLTVLAELMNIFEREGMWATTNSSVHMGVLWKKDGGKRLIGWYRAMFRLWCAARRESWRVWEAKHATDPFFAAARRNSFVDVAWRMAARSEIATMVGQHVVIVAQYITKFYQHMRRHILATNAMA